MQESFISITNDNEDDEDNEESYNNNISVVEQANDCKPELPPTIVEKCLFGNICKLLTDINKTSKSLKKKQILQEFWGELNKEMKTNKVSLYPIMRLLLPQLDLERLSYGIKEKKIADLYVKCIPLTTTSQDAIKLLKYKNPKYVGSKVGDFSSVLYEVLITRCPKIFTKTIYDVNNDLKCLMKCKSSCEKARWYRNAIESYTSIEHFWLTRIILKDMKCGMRHESCLNYFHPNALEIYNMTNSLRKVCDLTCNNNNNLSENLLLQVELFQPIRPMLASRKHWNQVTNTMNNFGVEIKYDGERVMIHYRKKDGKIMLWSRNAIDLGKKIWLC